MRSYQSYVGGADLSGDGWIHVIQASAMMDDPMGTIPMKRDLDRGGTADPADDRIAGRVALATTEQWEQAGAAARAAQAEWGARPLAERLAFGEAMRAAVESRLDEFVEVLVAEGHPRRLAVWEVAGVLRGLQPEMMDALAEQLERRQHVGGRETRLVRKPDGVVGLSPPQNAAASNSMLGLSVLFAGNTLVVKAPRSSPLGVAWAWRDLVAPVLADCGAPPGTMNLICAEPAPLLDHWLDSADIDELFYFGSSRRGIALGKRAAEVGKKAVLELAGNDGVLIWKDAELDLAARALVECFYGSSQICMVPKYAIVHPDVAEDLVRRVHRLLADVRPGAPEDDGALLSPVLKTERFFELLEESLTAGATLLSGGVRTDQKGVVDPAGIFLQPTVIEVPGLELAARLRAVREETFFPMLPVVVPESRPDGELLPAMLRFLDENPYGLRNSVWAQDPDVVDTVCRSVRTGGLLKVNDSHVGFAPGLPTHGGTGLTGGPFGEANFPAVRTSHLQGISIATGVHPRTAVFDSAVPKPEPRPAEPGA